MFEHAGEYAQAAVLRIEHARTLRDPADRLDVLREGCARTQGSTPQGRALHLALAESLLEEPPDADASRRRSAELEAARALEEAREFAHAGELYESLGLLRKAAAAYERGGEIARLELVLEVLERIDDARKQERDLLRRFDDAVNGGLRRYAEALLAEHAPPTNLPMLASEAGRAAARPLPAALRERRRWLANRILDRPRVDLGWGKGRVTAVRMGTALTIGRSPSADLTLPSARLSREHVRLTLASHDGLPRVMAMDLGSKVGTFWDGEALIPGEAVPLLEAGSLGLGMSTEIEVVPVRGRAAAVHGALVRASPESGWLLFLPEGGPLWLDPEIRVPARIHFDRGMVTFDLAAGVDATLGERPLGAGANIEFMLGDRLCLVGAPLCLEVVA